MNNEDLKSVLRKAKLPEPPGEYWDELPGRITRRLKSGASREVPEVRRPRPVMWALAGAAVCMIIGFAIGHWSGREDSVASNDFLQNTAAIREILTLFPNRVRAIVQDEGGLRLVLAEQSDVPDSPPLFIEIRDGNRTSTLVTFSGQEISIGGRRVTVLSDAQGGVILVGDSFLWSSREPNHAAGKLRIEAKELDYASG